MENHFGSGQMPRKWINSYLKKDSYTSPIDLQQITRMLILKAATITGKYLRYSRLCMLQGRKGLSLELHPAPRKQFLLILQGTLQIESSAGERRHFSPGSILLVTDIAGTRGHKSSVIGTKDVFAAIMPLP